MINYARERAEEILKTARTAKLFLAIGDNRIGTFFHKLCNTYIQERNSLLSQIRKSLPISSPISLIDNRLFLTEDNCYKLS